MQVRNSNLQVMHCKIRDKRTQTGYRDVYIPRITLYPKNVEQFGFEWCRRQFPVCPAFAMTVNASQASDFKHRLLISNMIYIAGANTEASRRLVGQQPLLHSRTALCRGFKVPIWASPFIDRMLYFNFAQRVGHPDGLLIAVMKEDNEEIKCATPNIVYREVLLHRGPCPTSTPAAPTPSTLAVPENDTDVDGIYDGFEDEEEGSFDFDQLNGPRTASQKQSSPTNLSKTLPVGVIPAALPSRGQAEVDEKMQMNRLHCFCSGHFGPGGEDQTP